MDCHQRRAARGVDGDRRALQAQPIADPARRCGIRRSDCHVGLDLGVSQLAGCHSQVVVSGQTDEHTGVGVRQSRWRGARMLHRPPRRLEQKPMLRVHQPDLARRHSEERRVEPRHVIDETCPTGHNLAGRTGFRVEEFVDIPSVVGHLGYRVPAFPQHIPKLVRIRGSRETRGVADDRKTRCRLPQTLHRCHPVVLPASAGEVSISRGRPDCAADSSPDGQFCKCSTRCRATSAGAGQLGRQGQL
jgi:hypothetical protein